MANFTTAFDLAQGALVRAGKLGDGLSPYQSFANKYLNQIHQAVLAGGNEFDVELGEPWPWAKASRPGVINLEIPQDAGTITVTNNSATATLTVTPSTSMVGRYLKVLNSDEYYRVITDNGSGVLTLDSVYNGTSGSGQSYKLIKIDYDLPSGVLRLVGPMKVYKAQDLEGDNEGKIYGIDQNAFDREFPLHIIDYGVPTYFAETQQTNAAVKTIRVNKYPTDGRVRVEFEYIPIPADLVNYVFVDTDVSVAGDTITVASHGMAANLPVFLENVGGTLPGALSTLTQYYVVNPTASTFQLSLTSGGSAVNISSAAGGGQHFVTSVPLLPREFRVVMEYAVAFWLMADKNDSRAEGLFALTKAKLQALVNAYKRERTHTAKDRGQLFPRLDLIGSGSYIRNAK